MLIRMIRPCALMLSMIVFSPAIFAKVVHDEQLWANINAFFKFSDNWQFYGEYQPRLMEDRKYLKAALYRTAVERKLSNGLALGVGYAFVEYPHPNYFHEHRPFLQGFHSFDNGHLKIVNRTRIEGRYFSHADDPSFRPRHMLRFQYAVDEQWKLILWDEYFWNANSIKPKRSGRTPVLREGFDQNRAFAGAGLAYGENFQHMIEAGYMNQYVNGRSQDRSNHTILIQSTLRF